MSTLSEFADRFQMCWLCDAFSRLQIHHICGRRGKDPHDRRNLFRICEHCHRLFHDGSRTERYIGMEQILYCKMYFDPEHYDPEYLAALRGKKHLGHEPVRPDWWEYSLVVTVPGRPVPQPRSRITRRGPPRAYVPKEHPVHAYRSMIATAAKALGCFPTHQPVCVEIAAVFKRPKSHIGKGGVKPGAPVVPVADVDNLAKAILDSLNGVAYADDKLVSKLVVTKEYSEDREYTDITVEHAA